MRADEKIIQGMRIVYVSSLPLCDICKAEGNEENAHFDTPMIIGGKWAYLCWVDWVCWGMSAENPKVGTRLAVRGRDASNIPHDTWGRKEEDGPVGECYFCTHLVADSTKWGRGYRKEVVGAGSPFVREVLVCECCPQ